MNDEQHYGTSSKQLLELGVIGAAKEAEEQAKSTPVAVAGQKAKA